MWAGKRAKEQDMIKIYETPVQVDTDGNVTNPEADALIVDGIEYRKTS